MHPRMSDPEIVGLEVCARARGWTLYVGGSQSGRLDLEHGLVEGVTLWGALVIPIIRGIVLTVEK